MKVAITGYASLDHVAMLDGAPRAGRTTTILARPADAWPRLGGSPAYAAMALMKAGVAEAVPVSWVGDDGAGAAYRAQLHAQGVSDRGIASVAGIRTPAAVLAYQPDGGCVCLYDPGTSQEPSLTQAQRALVAASDWLCITVGPKDASEAALEAMGADAKLAWVVKHDPRAMPAPLAARIAARADLVICSQAERDFLKQALAAAEATRPGLIAIETRGGAGAVLRRGDEETIVAAAPMKVADPTGAGDSFAGGVLAAVAGGEEDAAAILQAGHRAAAALLATRAMPEMESVRG